ncbi:MAG: two-component system CheB/CheR fusion protein, partial [Rhodoferax sp.]
MPTPEAALQQQLLTSQAELAVVKAKLKAAHQALRVLQTSGPDSELNHLLDGSGIAIIFMNTELHILRFTPAAALFVNLLPTDRGRNGAHLAAQFAGYDHLLDDARRVMATQKRHELLVQTQVGLWFEMRIWPYRRPDQVTMGVVITLIDIADRRRAAPADAPGAAQYQAMVAWSPEAINIVQDGRFVYLNPVAVQLYGARSAD